VFSEWNANARHSGESRNPGAEQRLITWQIEFSNPVQLSQIPDPADPESTATL
jgi:hypothetical protein